MGRSSADFRSLRPEAQEAIRLQAVKAVKSGKRIFAAAEVFGVSRRAISNWMRTDRQGGREALRAKKRGRLQGGGRLKPSQWAGIVNLIVTEQPDQMKLPFYLWTDQAVGNLIDQRCGIDYSVYQVRRYLKKWGFTLNKLNIKASKQHPEKVQNWLEKQYPVIQQLAKSENAEIQWCVEREMRFDPALIHRSSLKDQMQQRLACKMLSSTSNRGTVRFIVYTGRFTAEVMLNFIRRILKQIDRKVFLIVEGNSVHRRRAVQKFLAENEERVRLFQLPVNKQK
jgi:transposase